MSDGFVSRLRLALHEKGLGHVLKRALQTAISPLFSRHHEIRYEIALDKEPPALAAQQGIVIRQMKKEDCDAVLSSLKPPGAGYARSRLEDGHTCIVAWVCDEPAAYVWVAHKDLVDEPTGRFIPVAPDEAYGYDAYTHPRFRHLGIRRVLFLEEVRYGRSLGRQRLFAFLGHDVAKRAAQSLGFEGLRLQATEDIVRWRIAGRNYTWCRPLKGDE